MSEYKHLVVTKFKDDVVVEEIIKGIEKLASEIDTVKSLEWGQDIGSMETLRQGFTHAFLMTYNSKEDFAAFMNHPNHLQFSQIFKVAIEKIVVLDFPAVLAKPRT
ncbi:Ricin-agglutinin family protein [Heracleum sosnowskyi]|uniref:Ricin-agglutinin family protein n=1 Tax=Heracleum sosnowskyi TaxID=360622 RepID=A0AAD8M021_9APIA|nr:Ricin-agglutinin family protein [Heracleum sosnowskyi]